jgi:pilus assembly protein Flp/PilA
MPINRLPKPIPSVADAAILNARKTETGMRKYMTKLIGDQKGVTALEYALIAALVAVVIIGGVSLLGTNVSKVFSTVANTI